MTPRVVPMVYRFRLNNPHLIVKAVAGCAATDGFAEVTVGPAQFSVDSATRTEAIGPKGLVYIALYRKGERIGTITLDRFHRTFLEVF